jgi:ABC-type dipeptide/oligopeptide/nickel transport system permease subunit
VDAVNRIGRIGVVLLALLVAVAIFAPQLAPFDPHKSSSENFLPPDPVHLLGTNDIGQDIFSELLYGTRTSLAIGFLSAAISIVIGTLIGMLAGWFEGGLDLALMKLTAFFMTIPYLPAVIILSAFTRPGLLTTSLILGVMSWPGTARIVRAETMGIKKRGYLQVCRAMGAPSGYVLFRHVVKELLPLVMYRAAARVRAGILGESSLSFLGLGSAAQKSWGSMLYYAQARNALLTRAWIWWVLPPGLCIALVSCALTMISYSTEGKLDKRMEDLV